MSNLPWSKFYWADWSRDANLRACSYAAKGMWMDMLCHMDASPEKGYFLVGDRAATNAEIAKIIGGERRLVERLLAELEANGVFSRDARNAVFSRRMTRDCVKSRENSANGKLGGNPVLIKNKDLDEKPLNPPLKPGVKADTEADTEAEKEKTLKGKKESAAVAPKRRASYVPGVSLAFDEFWRRYPRKIEGPVAAKKAWDRAIDAGANPDAIVAGVARYPFDARDGGRFLPHATTWLNQGRWTTQADTLPLPTPGPRRITPTMGSPY
jgi:hypothetical protein